MKYVYQACCYLSESEQVLGIRYQVVDAIRTFVAVILVAFIHNLEKEGCLQMTCLGQNILLPGSYCQYTFRGPKKIMPKN